MPGSATWKRAAKGTAASATSFFQGQWAAHARKPGEAADRCIPELPERDGRGRRVPRLRWLFASSGLLDENGAGIEQVEAPALHVLLRLGRWLGGDDGDVAARGAGAGVGEPGREQRALDT